MHLMIIGAVAAGTKAAARARRVNPQLKITLFQDESEVAYTACGQPYHISGMISNREDLIIRKPVDFAAENISVHIRHRVTAIDPLHHVLTVYDRDRDCYDQQTFDRLIIATGASSIIPAVPGVNLEGVVTLRSFAELDLFKTMLVKLQPKKAVIVGSGYIGMEMLESLSALGISVTMLTRSPRIFSRFDADMSRFIQEYLLHKGIHIIAEDQITSIEGNNHQVQAVHTASGLTLPTDFVVLALGIKPNVTLATQAGIALGSTGAIAVNDRMETNIPGIFAAGDCVESRHRITGLPVWEPLGDIANLQGRVAGENAAGGKAHFPGVFGTSIFKTFALHVAMTGLTEKSAEQAGFNPIGLIINVRDKARYYPDTDHFNLKLVADSRNGKLLGAQAVGTGRLDKTIDIAATALLGQLSCADLENADLAYAPPYNPVLSPIIVAASALNKKIT